MVWKGLRGGFYRWFESGTEVVQRLFGGGLEVIWRGSGGGLEVVWKWIQNNFANFQYSLFYKLMKNILLLLCNWYPILQYIVMAYIIIDCS